MANLPSYEELMKSGKPIEKASLPSYEDVTKLKDEKSSIGQDLGDLAKGVGQGITFGAGDELLGAGQATKDLVTPGSGVNSLEDLLKAYRSHQKENEADYDEAKKRSPYLTMGGELAGGLLPGGALVKGMQGASRLAKVGMAAGAGGLIGANSSHGTIEDNPEQIAKDAAESAVLGGGIEGAGQALAPVAKKAAGATKDYLKSLSDKYDLVRQMGVAADRGLEGKGFISNPDTNDIKEGTKNLAGELTGNVKKGMDFANDKFKTAISSDTSPVKLDAEPLQALDTLSSIYSKPSGILETLPQTKSISAALENAKAGKSTMQDLQNLKNALQDVPPGGELYGYAQKAINGIDSALQKQMGDLYPEINKTYAQSRELGESLISNTPEEFRQTQMGDMNKPVEKLYGKSADVVQNSGVDAANSRNRLDRLNQLKSKLEELQGNTTGAEGPNMAPKGSPLEGGAQGPESQGPFKTTENPDLMAATGFGSPQELGSKIQKQSDLEGIMKLMQGNDLSGNRLDLLSLGQGKRAVLGATNLAGQVGNATTVLGHTLYSLPAKPLMGISQSLKSNPATQHLGAALEQSLQNPGDAARNAILFSIMQNPDARKQVEPFLPSAPKEGEE